MSDWNQQIIEGAVLLTVNQRLARHHRSLFSEWQLDQSKSWWESPAIYPLNGWLESLHAQALAKGLIEKALIPDLLAQQAWRRCIDQDTRVALLDTALASGLAQQSWQLSQSWQCFNPEEEYLTRDQYTWERWMRSYRQWLFEEQAIDRELLPTVLADLFNNPELCSSARGLLPGKLIFEGFLQITPQLEKLIESFRALDIEVVLPSRQASALIHTQHCSDDQAELLLIATQMRHELEFEPRQLLGLVVPDLHQRRSAVLRAFDQVFFPTCSPDEIRLFKRPYDFSLGLPLSEQPVIVSALLQLKLRFEQLESSDISTLLLTPYWYGSDIESAQREQLDKRLRESRVLRIDLGKLQSYIRSDSKFYGVLGKLKNKPAPDKASLTQWGDIFSASLRALGWPTESIDSEEYQAVSSWFECFDDMQILDDGRQLSAKDALTQLKSLAENRLFQPETPGTPIQIMGRLESHGIGFDCLWLAGLDADQWPPAGSPSPFLSISQQKACAIAQSTAAGRLELAEAEFEMWASTTPMLMLSTAIERDGNALTPAALPAIKASTQNISAATARLARLEAIGPLLNPAYEISQSMVLEQLQDSHGPELAAGSAVRGGARLFENQALCPFKAFALHRLNIRPLEEAGLGLDARQHGTLLHEALELFWKDVNSHETLLAMPESELNDKVGAVVDAAIESINVPERLKPIEKQRLVLLIHQWLTECEKPRAAFVVDSLEQQLQIEHGGIVMNVILDRVDRVDNTLAVIDYKTGVNNKATPWADTRIANPQLPLYVLTNEEIAAASFAQVASNQCKFIGVASDSDTLPRVSSKLARTSSELATDQPLTSWSEWRTHWKSSLDAIAAEVRAGVASVTPMKTACQFCELKSLCRINDHDQHAGQADESTAETNAELVMDGDW